MDVKSAKVHDAADPARWIDLYGDYLYRYALMRLRDTAAAEDAVQETFLAAWKARDRFDGRVQEKHWLRGILRNKVVDHIRKTVREHPADESDVSDLQDSFLMKAFGVPTLHAPEWGFDPRRACERIEFWDVFRSCLKVLPERIQQVFTLRMLEDVSSEEVCKIMNVSPNNLWVMMHRARNQLRECLKSKWTDPTVKGTRPC